MAGLQKEEWLREAKWNSKLLRRHLSKALGMAAHAKSREAGEIENHARGVLERASKARVGMKEDFQSISSAISFSKKASKEIRRLEKEAKVHGLKSASHEICGLIEKGMENTHAIDSELEKMGDMKYLEFCEATHRVAGMMEEGRENLAEIYGRIGNPAGNLESAPSVLVAKKEVSSLLKDAHGKRISLERKYQAGKIEGLKSRLVQAMIAAQAGRLVIEGKSIVVKSTFNGKEESFEVHEPMRKALHDFFEGEEISGHLAELAQGKSLKLVGSFEAEFSEGQPNGIRLSIGRLHTGTEAFVYRPVRMRLGREHVQLAARMSAGNRGL